jgi:hypothetical protein
MNEYDADAEPDFSIVARAMGEYAETFSATVYANTALIAVVPNIELARAQQCLNAATYSFAEFSGEP